MIKLAKSLDRTDVLVIGGLLAFVALACFGLYEGYQMDKDQCIEQKECYKEITQLIQKESSWKKVDWIKKTVDVERSALGGVNFCKVLDLVRGALYDRDNEKSEISQADKHKENTKKGTHE